MTYQATKRNPNDVTTQELRASIIRVIEHLDHECEFFPEGEIPDDHLAAHIERLVTWCNTHLPDDQDTNGYSGWTNYETWLVALWLDNDQTTYEFWRNDAAGVLLFLCDVDTPDEKHQQAAGLLARRLKEAMEPENEPLTGLSHDMLAAAYAAVNWREVATHILDGLAE